MVLWVCKYFSYRLKLVLLEADLPCSTVRRRCRGAAHHIYLFHEKIFLFNDVGERSYVISIFNLILALHINFYAVTYEYENYKQESYIIINIIYFVESPMFLQLRSDWPSN